MITFASLLCVAALALPTPQAPEGAPIGPNDETTAVERSAADPTATQADTAETEPLVTDRPDATESAVTVAPGLVQLETGYTFSSVERTDGHSLGEVLLRIGVSDELELRAGINSYEWARGPGLRTDGLTDTSVGLKWKIADGGAPGSGKPGLAIIAATSLPTGADALSDGAAQPEVILAASLDLSERLGLGANVGWSLRQDGELDERFSEVFGSLALGYGLSERWGAYVEYFGAFPSDGRDEESFMNGGLTYLISNDLQLDGRLGYGLNGRDDDLFLGFGAAVRW